MAMLGMRAPSMLPSITCSNCGDNVPMDAMADHLCRSAGAPPRGGHARSGSRSAAARAAKDMFPPARQQQSRSDRVDSGQFFRSSDLGDAMRSPSGRASPPRRIDPAAANRPYARRDVYASNSPQKRDQYDYRQDRDEYTKPIKERRDDYSRPVAREDYGYREPSQSRKKPSEDMKRNNDNPYPTLKPPSPALETPKSGMSSSGFFSNNINYKPKEPSLPRSTSPRAQKDEAKRDEFFSRAPSMIGSGRSAPKRSDAPARNPYSLDNDNPYAQPPRDRNPYDQGPYGNDTKNDNPYGIGRSPSAPPHNSDRGYAPPARSNTTNDFYGGGSLPYRSQSDRRPSDVAPLPNTTYGRYGDGRNGSDSSSDGSSGYSRNGSSNRSGQSTPPSEFSPGDYGRNEQDNDSVANPFNPYGKGNAPPRRPDDRPNVKPYPPRPTQQASDRDRSRDRSRERDAPNSKGLMRSGTDASMSSNTSSRPRHVCRGCATPIVGKSIKAADGQLTGRYHRQCFNCTTCQVAFSSSQFYVFRDAPYCEYHYHALNGSLCTSCDGGIEGQYLETEKREMFHPKCLTCKTCRTVLGEEYFEVRGGVYCERHATAEVRRLEQQSGNGMRGPGQGAGGPGGGAGGYTWRAERRRTRMGIM